MNNETQQKKARLAAWDWDGDSVVSMYVAVPSGLVDDKEVMDRKAMMGWSEFTHGIMSKDLRKMIMRTAYASGCESCFFRKDYMFFGPLSIAGKGPFWCLIFPRNRVLKDDACWKSAVAELRSGQFDGPSNARISKRCQHAIDNVFSFAGPANPVLDKLVKEAVGVGDSGAHLPVRPDAVGPVVDGGQDPAQGPA